MAVPHYAYLKLKMPGPKGVITINGNFQRSDSCDRDFSKISEMYWMEQSLAELEVSNDRTPPPEGKKMAIDRELKAISDVMKHKGHPTEPSDTVNMSPNPWSFN